MEIMRKFYGDVVNQIFRLTLENHPGKALVKIEEKSNDTYSGFPKSWYEMGAEDDALLVLIEPAQCGEWILEFYK